MVAAAFGNLHCLRSLRRSCRGRSRRRPSRRWRRRCWRTGQRPPPTLAGRVYRDGGPPERPLRPPAVAPRMSTTARRPLCYSGRAWDGDEQTRAVKQYGKYMNTVGGARRYMGRVLHSNKQRQQNRPMLDLLVRDGDVAVKRARRHVQSVRRSAPM